MFSRGTRWRFRETKGYWGGRWFGDNGFSIVFLRFRWRRLGTLSNAVVRLSIAVGIRDYLVKHHADRKNVYNIVDFSPRAKLVSRVKFCMWSIRDVHNHHKTTRLYDGVFFCNKKKENQYTIPSMIISSLINILGTANTKLKIQAQPIKTLARRPENVYEYGKIIKKKKVIFLLFLYFFAHSYWRSSSGAWWRRICRCSERPIRTWTNTWRPPGTHRIVAVI